MVERVIACTSLIRFEWRRIRGLALVIGALMMVGIIAVGLSRGLSEQAQASALEIGLLGASVGALALVGSVFEGRGQGGGDVLLRRTPVSWPVRFSAKVGAVAIGWCLIAASFGLGFAVLTVVAEPDGGDRLLNILEWSAQATQMRAGGVVVALAVTAVASSLSRSALLATLAGLGVTALLVLAASTFEAAETPFPSLVWRVLTVVGRGAEPVGLLGALGAVALAFGRRGRLERSVVARCTLLVASMLILGGLPMGTRALMVGLRDPVPLEGGAGRVVDSARHTDGAVSAVLVEGTGRPIEPRWSLWVVDLEAGLAWPFPGASLERDHGASTVGSVCDVLGWALAYGAVEIGIWSVSGDAERRFYPLDRTALSPEDAVPVSSELMARLGNGF